MQTEDDRIAYATMTLLHRNVLRMELLEPWVDWLAGAWAIEEPGPIPPECDNAIKVMRALHLQLLFGVRTLPWTTDDGFYARPPSVRVELLGKITSALGTVGEWYRPSSQRNP
jgi:hypothetical protein